LNLVVLIPQYLVYDNACQLKRHEKKLVTPHHQTERLNRVKNIYYVVDRLHIVGHKQEWCKAECHPDLFEELNGVNTVIVEQIYAWLGKFKFMTKHMNLYRFNFFYSYY